MNRQAKLVVLSTIAIGASVLLSDSLEGFGYPGNYFWVYLAMTAAVSLLDVQLQTRGGDLSLGIVFALAGFAQLTLPQSYALSVVAGTLPLFKRRDRRIVPWLVVFQLAVAVLSLKAANLMYKQVIQVVSSNGATIGIILSCPALIGVSSYLLASYESAQQRVRLLSIWPRDYAWSIVYYVGCSAGAALLVVLSALPTSESLMIMLPLLILAGRSLKDERLAMDRKRQRLNDFTGLQMGVLQVMAQAMEAREGRGVIHFERLARYAHGLGRAMGMEGVQLMALEAGALLHDVGKLAIPDYLLTKPDSLTPEEFELLKQHPVIGADIIERASLPFPVAPMVRAHQENWDGTGYPDGRKGTEIPAGARVLRVLDALDALTADRPYRRGLSLHDAVAQIQKDEGLLFDPAVVQCLVDNYRTWEKQAADSMPGGTIPSGLETKSVATMIAETRREEQTLTELVKLLKASLDLEGTMLRLERELSRIIPHETMVVFRLRDAVLTPWHICGENHHTFQSAQIPLGRGVSGLVARTGRGVADGMAAADVQFTDGQGAACRLQSILSVPMVCNGTVAGVLSLYSDQEMYFTAGHLRLLTALAPSLASWLENSLLYYQAKSRASTDGLTGLPNAASLFAHLQNEIARAGRAQLAVSVVVCDLDGFKAVNDRFGHLVGNQLLKAIGAGLKSNCREYDFVSRMGGDEFVVILPGMDLKAAQVRCQVLEEVVVAAGIEVCGEECVHMSSGIAQLGPDGRNPDELVTTADLRMYEQKQLRKSAPSYGSRQNAGFTFSPPR